MPDLAQLGNTWIAEFAALHALAPLQARVAQSRAIRPDDYFANAWATNVVAGTLYGVLAASATNLRLAPLVGTYLDELGHGWPGRNHVALYRRLLADHELDTDDLDDDPEIGEETPATPWVALAYDASPGSVAEASRILAEVDLSRLPLKGAPAGPDYQLHWVDRTRPGIAKLWPLPWPGRHDRAGWVSILVSWLLMMLLAALAVLIAILIFQQAPQVSPPPPVPTNGSGSPSPQSGSPSPQSGSPSPSSASPSPQSGSPSGPGSPTPNSRL